jgi:hypothetical protein
MLDSMAMMQIDAYNIVSIASQIIISHISPRKKAVISLSKTKNSSYLPFLKQYHDIVFLQFDKNIHGDL